MNRLLKRVRSIVRRLGWDVIRYHPIWPTLAGMERLPVRTVLDIGAYDGDTARIFRRLFPAAHLYCFEPQPEPFKALEAWAATQKGMVHALPFALGNHNGTAELHWDPNAPRMASLTSPWPNRPNGRPDAITRLTPIMRLDDAVNAHVHLTDGLLVKIDVEGSERAAVEGGPETLRRCVACIMEFHAVSRFAGQMNLREGLEVLAELGLEYGGVLQQHFKGGRLMYFDVIFVNRTRTNAPAI